MKKCAYCGTPATTVDHVVAKCLLVDSTAPVVVDACDECNAAKSRDDEYLRDMFAIRSETALLPEMKSKSEKMVKSALREGRYLSPGHTIIRTLRRMPIVTQAGDLAFVATVEASSERIFSGLKWIVRGLYYRHQGIVLDPNYDYQWWAYSGKDNREKFDAIWPMSSQGRPFLVGGCLVYKVGLCAGVPEYSNWLLAFYGRLFFIISINEQTLIQQTA